MSGEPTTVVTGNLTNDPELRFLSSGAAVCSFTIANTPRKKDGDQWVEGVTWFVRCSVWRQQAESVAETLRRGDRVIAMGSLKARTWEKDGQKRETVELDVIEVGPSLLFGARKAQRASQPAGDDPWGVAAPATTDPPF